MKLTLTKAPWVSSPPGRDLIQSTRIVADSVWLEAAVEFFAQREARLRSGLQAPKGVQPFLNDVLDARFRRHGWEGDSGRYRKHSTWVRITFRHSMSLGSDFIDALRVARREGVDQLAICAASPEFLRLISPNDAGALVSYDRAWAQAAELTGALDIPLYLGKLTPLSALPPEVASAIGRRRPRDRYEPS